MNGNANEKKTGAERRKLLLVAVGIACIGLISRSVLTCVGPVVEFIKTDLSISNSLAGFLTTIPLLVFAGFSPFVSRLSEKTGMSRLIVLGLIFIVVGLLVRSYCSLPGLLLGTAVIGSGIAIMNVLTPAIIKAEFAGRVGLMTGIYTTFMGVTSSVGAGFSAPLADVVGWSHTLAVWVVVALLVLVIWLPQCRNNIGKPTAGDKSAEKLGRRIFKIPLAWQVTFFMGLQSLLFYAFVAWLPTIVAWKGYTLEQAGYFALLYQVICIPASFITPIFCDKYKDQRVITTICALIYVLGMTLFLLAQGGALLVVAIVLCGIGSGAAISFAMAFMALRAGNSTQAAELSGMSQSIGYLLAAPATTIMGYIFDITQTWNIPIMMLIAVTVIWLLFGLKAGADKKLVE